MTAVALPNFNLRLAERSLFPKVFGVWMCILMLGAIRRIVVISLTERVGYWIPFAYAILDAFIWTWLTLGLFWLVDRIPLEKMTLRTVLGITPILLIASAVRLLLEASIMAGFAATPGFTTGRYFSWFLSTAGERVFIDTALVLAGGYVLRAYRLRQIEQLRAAEMERHLAVAELDNLRAQLQPHFLFNTLNSITSLIGEDEEGARRMVARLSELLRLSLATMRRRAIPLAEELEIVSRYLEIQRVRFADRLVVETDVPDFCLDALIPPFLLQPLVENAVKHGVAESREGCRIRLDVRCDGRALRIVIENDCALNGPVVERVGLSNTRGRLRAAYGEDASLDIVRSAGRMVVVVSIPLQSTESIAVPAELVFQ